MRTHPDSNGAVEEALRAPSVHNTRPLRWRISQAPEMDAGRRRVRTRVLGIPEHPQLVTRVGRPARGGTEVPATPRRALHSVLLPA
jgi:hypothetical protein